MDEERRKRLLTDADVKAIGEEVASLLPVCQLGLTVENAAVIKGLLHTWKKATGIIGTVVLTTIAIFLVGIFTKGFWMSLIEGIKKG